jgi:hypothetical protein
MKLFRQSDYKRWKNPDSYLAWWHSRTEKIAKWVPDGSRVLEFGAGGRHLESLLGSNCEYIPSDLVDRGPGTVVCDLNQRPLPDLKYLMAHVAVFAGVLEYLNDLPSLVEWLSFQAALCIVSYECLRSKPHSLSRVVEMSNRAYRGYMSNYTKRELITLFERNGFACTKTDSWRDQEIFVFARSSKDAEQIGAATSNTLSAMAAE